MNLDKLKSIFADYGADKIYVKKLAANDNSKNQVYLGGNFEILNILPITNIINEAAGDWERERFKAKLDFGWLQDDGQRFPAPNAQLILYPKYPEVRFSGFLLGSLNAPSDLMTQRLEGRLLFLGIGYKGMVHGYVASPNSIISNEFYNITHLNNEGVFSVLYIGIKEDSKALLLKELKRIHLLDWIPSKRLNSLGEILQCNSPNCGGYTLEAELGIRPNGYSEPDFHGWEVKQFNVSNFDKLDSSTITLMTPEPTGGIYKEEGVAEFVRRYGYEDLKGRENRRNFGGVHKYGIIHPRTQLNLILEGFDKNANKIRQTGGKIALIDNRNIVAASWDFSSLLIHWNRKHNNACYVPSMNKLLPDKSYKYGHKLILGQSTDFVLVLSEIARGNIYYDPGIKVENIDGKEISKRRSQFRVRSRDLKNLYHHHSVEIL